MKPQIGEVSFEEYKNMAFLDTSFDYYSRNEQVEGLAMLIVVNGAKIAVGVMLPWPIMVVAWGLASGGKDISDAVRGKDLLTGEELSTREHISRGLSGIVDVALAAYGTYKGVQVFKGTKGAVVGKKASRAKATLTHEIVRGTT
ncbi:pre-toxin TG domain-containing protein [Enterococcus sp. AZ177]|uniref:pre-toxin TG domain-containing protein n=1 Tax=unclassified Enterococcus TaxID=2608891 RepID=UPI003D2FBEB9